MGDMLPVEAATPTELSDITKPFAFDKYFEQLIKSGRALNQLKKMRLQNKGADHGGGATRKRSSSKLPVPHIMDKASSCFICGQQFAFNELSEHEKTCLENIKANDFQYTRQNTDEHTSSLSSRPESLSLSTHSGSSNETNESIDSSNKKCVRCYICGTDVPTYLKGIHEKACKKNWESGLLNVERKSHVRSEIFSSLSRSTSRSEINNTDQAAPKPGGLRKAKSSTLYRQASCNNALSVSTDDLSPRKNSKSTTNLNKNFKSATNLSVSNSNKKSISSTNISKSKSQTSLNNSSSQSDLTTKCMDLRLDFPDNKPIRNASSVSNLNNKNKTPPPLRIPKMNPSNKTKSLQDLGGGGKDRNGVPSRPISPASPTSLSPRSTSSPIEKQKNSNNPQYVVCHLCGKLYSQHSIVIHIKQCEKTRAMQVTMGTNSDYKIKSRSLADLSKGNVSKQRVNSVSNLAGSATNRTPRPSTTRSSTADRPKRTERPKSAIISSTSMDSLTPKKDTGSTYLRKSIHKDLFASKNKPPVSKPPEKPLPIETERNVFITPGLQKCYLCGQLYGTRSLPIHQKQCYVKQERAKEEEAKKKKKQKKKDKDIPVHPFGRTSFSDNSSEIMSTPLSRPRPHSAFVSSNIFDSDDIFGMNGLKSENTNGHHIDIRSLGSSVSSETGSRSPRSPTSPISPVSPRSPTSPSSIKDMMMMMTCVHCGCQCEPYTMAIHEKVCRKINIQNGDANPEIRIDSNHSDAVGYVNGGDDSVDIMGEKITNGGLIHCEGCSGEFFSSEIFQHRVNCRTSIL